ncbi:Hypothetical predicted protein, partial [Paramuricea clavata]
MTRSTSDLLTFGTAFGRYKFKRMPYGIHSASEIFHLEISKIIAGCEGAVNSQDNIIVWNFGEKPRKFMINAWRKSLQKPE